MSSFLNLDNYKLIGKIGEGSFGIVYKVKEKGTDNYYAAKVTKNEISDTQKDSDHGKGLYYEVNLMAKFNHPAILQFIGYSPTDFQGSSNPTIITSLAINGTLRDIIKLESEGRSPSGWDFTKKLINIYGIAIGMQYLHKNDILHRDLKPENIFMDESYWPKIADFGLSKSTTSAGLSQIFKSGTDPKGTLAYLPPEINLGKTRDSTKKGDVYAFSIIVYEILTTNCPFKDMSDLFKKITQGYRPEIPSFVPDSYKNLIDRCWSEEPEERPSFDEIVEELSTDSDYIVDLVDESEFLDYVSYIEEAKTTFNKNSQRYHYKDFVSKKKTNNTDKENVSLYPQSLFEGLSGQYQELVIEAETNGHKQFLVGKNLIEGIDPFQQNTQLGIKYLTKSIESGNNEAIFYYCRMLIESDLIPEDLELARSHLLESSIVDEPETSVLLGKIEYKKGNYEIAKDYYIKASKKGNGESMFLYALMLMKGEGVAVNNDESLKYFTLAIKNGYNKKPPQITVAPTPTPTQKPSKEPVKQETVKKEKKKSSKKQQQSNDTSEVIKFVAVGDAIDQCKQRFLMTITNKPFSERYVPTIFENCLHDVEIDGKKYTFAVWDTVGQDEYDRLRPLSYSGAKIVGLTFPMYSRSAFSNISEKWIKEIDHYCKDAARVLIGLCLDEVVMGNANHVTVEEAKKFAHDMNFDGFITCSVRTGEGIDDVFPTLLRALKSKNKNDGSCIIA